MRVNYCHRFFRRVALPIFNTGTALVAAGYAVSLGAIAILVDAQLAVYMLLFGYMSFVITSLVIGSAPAYAYLPNSKLNWLLRELDDSKNLSRVAEETWAPKRYTSPLWKSDRIYIERGADDLFKLVGRFRDVRLITESVRSDESLT